jgi:hypothetical protein
MNRFYSMNVGRWHSPDPVGGDITNPQSLNRYAYVMNNHTTLTDPLGLGPCIYGIDQWTGKNCNPQQAAQSNADDPLGILSNVYSIINMDQYIALEQATPPPTYTYEYDVVTVNGTSSETAIDTGAGIEFQESLWYPGTTYVIPIGVTITTSDTGGWGVLLRSSATLLPQGYYFNPIDQAVNTHHAGQWSFRQIMHTVCSSHVTVDKTTGQESTHVDTVNPVPGWPLLFGPGGSAFWSITAPLHYLFDVKGLYPASVACQ